jgi:esterase
MQFALEYPEMVDRLVVVDIGTKAYQGGHQQIFDALFSLDLSNIKYRSEADEALKEKIDSFAIRQFLLKNLHRRKVGGYEWKMNLPVIYRDYKKILQSITHDEEFEKDALFIRGGGSDYVLDEDWPDIQQLFPQSELKTIDNVGHWVHAEAPKELIDSVRQFLTP